jgi:hypothetical protein
MKDHPTPSSERAIARQLADVAAMLRSPDVYTREYIASVCEAVEALSAARAPSPSSAETIYRCAKVAYDTDTLGLTALQTRQSVVDRIRALAATPAMPAPVADRTTFTIPAGHEAIRDADERATGETRSADALQPFERYPNLAWEIGRMATTGGMGSLVEWDRFLKELNAALSPADAEPCQICGVRGPQFCSARMGTGLADAEPVARDWTEDFKDENGNYDCRCAECDKPFIAHKRRVLCKVCSNLLASTASPVMADEVTDEQVETACKAFADATDYYIKFHRGLSSASFDRMRVGMRAALAKLRAERGEI